MKNCLASLACLLYVPIALAGPPVGYQAKVAVTAPTRLDWTFVVTNQSLATPPPELLGPNYDSTQQHYELFVPANYQPKQSHALVLFIAPGNGPGGWKNWEAVCKKHGVLFASPHGAGNNVPMPRRVRIVLDTLDDVRRKYTIDPDRTYITGFSGGGRVACGIAFALPECFGGAAPICASGDLRDEPWLRHRLVERLSVALVTGETDFNRGEVERWRTPLYTALGVRARAWIVPKLGHGVPGGDTLAEVFAWLEQDLPRRQALAGKFPTTRIPADAAPARADWARGMLDEGMQRLKGKDTLHSGLMLLMGCMIRFQGTPAAAEARKILAKYEDDESWKPTDVADQRRLLIAHARALTNYATGPLPAQYSKLRPQMAKQALVYWSDVLRDGQDAQAVEEARKHIPQLQELAEIKDR